MTCRRRAPSRSSAALGQAPAAPRRLRRSRPLEAATLAEVRAALPQRTVPALSEPLVAGRPGAGPRGRPGRPAPALLRRRCAAALGERASSTRPRPPSCSRPASASLPEAVAAAAQFRGATHLGIGVVIRDELAWAVLLASERRAELDPFPRRVRPGSRVGAARAAAPARRSPGSGWRRRPAPPSRSRSEARRAAVLRRTVHFDRGRTWRVEVGGTGARGSTVAALLEVDCGDGQAASPTPDPWTPVPIRRARRRGPHPAPPLERAPGRARGFAPLRGSSALDEQAARHSRGHARPPGTVAHRLTGGERPGRRGSAAAGHRATGRRGRTWRAADGAARRPPGHGGEPGAPREPARPGRSTAGTGNRPRNPARRPAGGLPHGDPGGASRPRPGRRVADRGALSAG